MSKASPGPKKGQSSEEYGQVPSEVSKEYAQPHPGTTKRKPGAERNGAVKGGEGAKPGQMPRDDDKSPKEP